MTAAGETFRFSKLSLAGDYFRGAGGLLVSVLVIYVTGSATWALVVFGPLALLFVWFLYRTVERQLSEIELAEPGVIRRGLGERRIAWKELSELKLRFYGTRREVRNRSGGVLHMRLADERGTRISVDSGLQDFDKLVSVSASKALNRGLQMDSVTVSCLMDMGIGPFANAGAARGESS